jgi:uncharacterized membrane protein YgdD (TMEM256/DUF423 family)
MVPPQSPALSEQILEAPPIPVPPAEQRSMFYSKSWTSFGAIMATLAVALGAFGAHGADEYFAELYVHASPITVAGLRIPAAYKRLQDYNTAARYHMYHALALLVVGLLSRERPKKSLQLAGWSFLLGIMLFSGSLYYLALTGARWLGMVTPFGGVLFIVGWIALAVAAVPTAGKSVEHDDLIPDELLA